jgi:hypothetical protein
VHCGIGSWRGRCLSLADYVIGTRAPRGRPPPEGASVGYPLLGLEVTSETPGFVVLGGLWLGTHSEVHGPNADPARHMIGLTSNDLAGDWKRLRDAGVEFIEDPTDYGTVRIATLKDPEGNLVQLLESARAA